MKEVDVLNPTLSIMTLKFILQVFVQCEIILITSSSITGITYMDNFDFEERYRNDNECNPFYYHPLHLPAHCAHTMEKLIRSKLASKTPVRIVTKKKKKHRKHHHHSSRNHQPIYGYAPELLPYPVYEINSAEYEEFNVQYSDPIPSSPYEDIIELLKEDIKKDPSSPTVTVMPNLGAVALYNQGISKKSENKIRAISKAYVKAIKKQYDEYYAAYKNFYPQGEPQLFVYDSAKNTTKAKTENKKDKDNDKKDGKKDKVYRMKTKHGNVVTIIETKNVEMMKDKLSN